jgi:glutaredoxin 3
MEKSMNVRIALAFLAALLLTSPAVALDTPAAGGKSPQVEIFTTSWCPYCVRATNFLRANDIPFVEYDVEKDAGAARRLQEMTGRGGVPFVIIDGHKIHGWSEQAYKRALGLD